jgi:hypothetical protein
MVISLLTDRHCEGAAATEAISSNEGIASPLISTEGLNQRGLAKTEA